MIIAFIIINRVGRYAYDAFDKIFDKNNFAFYQPLIEQNEGVQAGRLMDKIFINNAESNSYTFKKNYYFVQGDNSTESSDSRHWGLISESQLIGKAAFTYHSNKK